jgi:hypothetical protein
VRARISGPEPAAAMVTGVEGEKAPALRLETLLALGLDQRTAENALVNSKVTANLAAVIAEVTTPPLVAPSSFDSDDTWLCGCC